MISIGQATAQQIVDMVKDVCGYDINYISREGIIIASTDRARISDFHEIGRKAADLKETLEVYENNLYDGTQKGLNIPFVYRGETVGVIGITGEPDEVRRYARLAVRIMRLLLKEREVEASKEWQKAEQSYVVKALMREEQISREFLVPFLEERKLTYQDELRVVVFASGKENSDFTVRQNDLEEQLASFPASFYGFDYPNYHILIIKEEAFAEHRARIRELAGPFERIGVGSRRRITRIHESWRAALAALRSGEGTYTEFESLFLELLLTDTSEKTRQAYVAKTLGKLSTKEIEILNVYCQSGMSLKDSAETLYVHKNTLQYQLDRIHAKTGLNPRSFQDCTVFSIALRLYHGMKDRITLENETC